MMKHIAWVKVVSGGLQQYLKDIPLFGRIDHEKNFLIYGCNVKDESAFYEGLLEYDKVSNVIGFNDIAEVEEYWMNDADMFLTLNNGDYEIME